MSNPDVDRIVEALEAARRALHPFEPGDVDHEDKGDRGERWNPVTEADLAVDRALRSSLPRPDEGWLSEEIADDASRLECRRVWVVDPLDGTREFVQGVPDWAVSVGLVEEGRAVAGGILNPALGHLIVGALGTGVTLNGRPVRPSRATSLSGTVVLASRSEVDRGEWRRFEDADFEIRPCGSVAYKLGLVAAGVADATWTLVPKNEWDVAAGTALCRAAGLTVVHADGSEPVFNQADPLLPNLIAGPEGLVDEFRERWS